MLLGRSPREVYEPKLAHDPAIARLVGVPAVPSDLPSNLLERRPRHPASRASSWRRRACASTARARITSHRCR
jgi:hypothetical protein